MTRSVNETEMMVLKAARGANVPIGQAQVVAKVIAANPSPEVIEDFLTACREDCSGVAQLAFDPLVFSNFVLLRDGPSVFDALKSGVPKVSLRGVKNGPLLQAMAQFFGAGCDEALDGIVLTCGDHPSMLGARGTISDAHWDALNAWAAKTYVPETEESRLGGAGAGLTDND